MKLLDHLVEFKCEVNGKEVTYRRRVKAFTEEVALANAAVKVAKWVGRDSKLEILEVGIMEVQGKVITQ